MACLEKFKFHEKLFGKVSIFALKFNQTAHFFLFRVLAQESSMYDAEFQKNRLYDFESRGSIEVKGLGMEPTYFVEPCKHYKIMRSCDKKAPMKKNLF